MPDRGHVTSVEALEEFRAKLIIYQAKARAALEDVSADVTHTRLWIENEQRIRWESEVRRRAKALEQAQQELFGSRISTLREESSTEQMAVQRAKRAFDEADAKLRLLKKWNRDFGSHVEPLVKQLEKLHTFLTHDMVLAAAYLAEAVKTLEAYAELSSSAATPAPAAPASAASPEESGATPNPVPGASA